jgi:hypothetical protein
MKVSRSEDRRRFFRITDAIGVAYSANQPSKQSADNNAGIVSGYKLIQQQSALILTALEELAGVQPAAAKAIAAVNKKLDTLITLVELDNLTGQPAVKTIEEASISACGIAFPVNEILASDTIIFLTLYLDPSGDEVDAVGRVVDCKPLSRVGDYYLRVEFTEVENNGREKLIQHIVQRQGSLLRSLKDQADKDL